MSRNKLFVILSSNNNSHIIDANCTTNSSNTPNSSNSSNNSGKKGNDRTMTFVAVYWSW